MIKSASNQKNQPALEKFQKYPKNYQQNHHYRSVKQKLMTLQDDQEIIKFPLTTSVESRKSSNGTSPDVTPRKVQKYKGKKFLTVPLKTISYSTPLNCVKKEELSRRAKTSRKQEEENKFGSKNLFTNMKKLKDLRKTNYKNRIASMERKQNPQKPKEDHQLNLDLFRLTSTNFNYKERIFSDGNDMTELSRKFTKTQGESRNVIKFQKPAKLKQSNFFAQLNKQSEENGPQMQKQENFIVLYPVQTQETHSVEKVIQKGLIETKSTKNFQSNRLSEGRVQNLIHDESSGNFVRYSQAIIDPQNQKLKNGLKKLRDINKSKNEQMIKKSQFQHIHRSFRGSFRVKHVEDNKNILLNTIKKKASIMERDELVDYLRKVVQ